VTLSRALTDLHDLQCIRYDENEDELLEDDEKQPAGMRARRTQIAQMTITTMGRQISQFPVDPMLARTIICSPRYKCSNEVLTIASVLSTYSKLFVRPREEIKTADRIHDRFSHIEGDHLTLLNVMTAYLQIEHRGPARTRRWCSDNFVDYNTLRRAKQARDQMSMTLERIGGTAALLWKNLREQNYYDNILMCFLEGFFKHVAYLDKDKKFRTIDMERRVKIFHRSFLDYHPDWVMYDDISSTQPGRYVISQVSRVSPAWLIKVAGKKYYNQNKLPKSEGKTYIENLFEKLWNVLKQEKPEAAKEMLMQRKGEMPFEVKDK